MYKNEHHDIVMEMDVNGNNKIEYEYDDYGKLKNGVVSNNPFRYTGEYYDEESGYYYLRARYYSPEIRRFINEDTYKGDIKDPLSLNYYAYCAGNPIMYTDPSGHTVLDLIGGAIYGIAETITFGMTRNLEENLIIQDREDFVKGKIAGNYVAGSAADAGMVGGAGVTATGVGAPAGVIVVGASGAVKASAAGNLIINAAELAMLSKGNSDGGGNGKKYHPAPDEIECIEGLKRAKSKTSVQGGGSKRRRWKDEKGNVYEWDSQHGELEKYDKRGRHKGAYDYKTGEQIKEAIKNRKIEP